MPQIRYRIYTLSASALLGYAKEVGDGGYAFSLNAGATEKCKVRAALHEQQDCALFFQAMCVLHGDSFQPSDEDTLLSNLADFICYVDFSNIFDRNAAQPRHAVRQKKAESMFRPEGITLDFGTGPHRYLAFERSGSMSRKAQLSFIREDFYESLRKRVMMDMKIGDCQLSKLYAYNGLMLSGGMRIDNINIDRPHRVIVIDNPAVTVPYVPVITVEDNGSAGSVRKYHRVERHEDIQVTLFDGEGLISKEYAKVVDKAFCGGHIHTSFQIRLPYIKGMLHQVDFKDFLISGGTETITDLWGVKHNVRDVDIILTKSMFKGYGWLMENGMSWEGYWDTFRRYRHALYITNVSKEKPEKLTTLNYQFLNTVSITAKEFRPGDLPLGWKGSPADDEWNWPTKETESAYYNYCADEDFRKQYFLSALERRQLFKKSKAYRMAEILKKNPLFINEPVYTKELNAKAEQVLKQYAVGQLIVAGDNRFLSGNLLEFLTLLLDGSKLKNAAQKRFYEVRGKWYEPTFRQKRKSFFEKTDWGRVDSNLERLPYLAYQLQKDTPKIKPKPAKDCELFSFAQGNWEDSLDPQILSVVSDLLRDYEACLSRIPACQAPIKEKPRKNDIERILFRRGQEDARDADELYAAFQEVLPERIADLRAAIVDRKWHFMEPASRDNFLRENLPELAEYHDLFADFRHGGYRILDDLICDIDDENQATDRKKYLRDTDSTAFQQMMNAYLQQPLRHDSRKIVSQKCRGLLDGIVAPRVAVRYVVALGKRNLLWDLLIDHIEENVRKEENIT